MFFKKDNQSTNIYRWNHHKCKLLKLNQYQAIGWLICFSKQKKILAHFCWQQSSRNQYRLLLTNPLGYNGFKLNIQYNVAQLVDSNGHCYISADAEKMINSLIGISIPISELSQWIIGLPGSAINYKLNNQHHIGKINYIHNKKKWNVTYNKYNNRTLFSLPVDIEITENNYLIKIIINDWILK